MDSVILVPDSQVVDQETQELIVFCLNNCLRANIIETFEDFDGVPCPVFKYIGQLSKNEPKVDKNCLALVLNVESGFSGMVIRFVGCAQEEIDLVKEKIFDIASEIIDFHYMLYPKQLYRVLNCDLNECDQ